MDVDGAGIIGEGVSGGASDAGLAGAGVGSCGLRGEATGEYVVTAGDTGVGVCPASM